MFGGRFGVSQTGAEYGLRSTLVNFFHKIILKKGFYTSRLPKNEKIGGIFCV
jgi:hypothetical protein